MAVQSPLQKLAMAENDSRFSPSHQISRNAVLPLYKSACVAPTAMSTAARAGAGPVHGPDMRAPRRLLEHCNSLQLLASLLQNFDVSLRLSLRQAFHLSSNLHDPAFGWP